MADRTGKGLKIRQETILGNDYIKEATISRVLLWLGRKPYSQEKVAVGLRSCLGAEKTGCLPRKGPLEAGNEDEEDSVCVVVKGEKVVWPWEVTSLLPGKDRREVRSCLTARKQAFLSK